MIQDTCKNCNVSQTASSIDPDGCTIYSPWCRACLNKLWGKEGYLGKSNRFTCKLVSQENSTTEKT